MIVYVRLSTRSRQQKRTIQPILQLGLLSIAEQKQIQASITPTHQLQQSVRAHIRAQKAPEWEMPAQLVG
jgi:hypothetical protein